MGKKTPLYDYHLQAKAKMVDFAGWDMPLHYGSQVQEHHIVRTDAGVFDVSHMTIVDCFGLEIADYLRHLVANNIDRLTIGKALYTCMLNEHGGVIDDLIIYQLGSDEYRLIVNSATREKDLQWMIQQSKNFNVTIKERPDLAMMAVQGPKALAKLTAILPPAISHAMSELKPFHAITIENYFIAKTGYTGEEGVEIILPSKQAPDVWQQLVTAGISPCGLGARDTLRLEAGLNLYGADMDETVTPLESNLGWTVAFDPSKREFMGRKALEKQREKGIDRQLVGIILEEPGVLRNHQKIISNGVEIGEITSGSFSPTLNKGIALARVTSDIGSECCVEIRGKPIKARVIKPPFVKNIA